MLPILYLCVNNGSLLSFFRWLRLIQLTPVFRTLSLFYIYSERDISRISVNSIHHLQLTTQHDKNSFLTFSLTHANTNGENLPFFFWNFKDSRRYLVVYFVFRSFTPLQLRDFSVGPKQETRTRISSPTLVSWISTVVMWRSRVRFRDYKVSRSEN